MDRAQSLDSLERLAAAASKALVPLRLAPTSEIPGSAEFQGGSLNGVVVARIRADPMTVTRASTLISSTDAEILKFTLHLDGRAGIEQDDRQALLRPGDLVVYDSRRPYQLRYWDRYDTIVVGIPRTRLGSHADLIGRRNALALPADAGVRSLMATFLAGVADTLDTVSPVAGVHLGEALASLLVSVFSDTPAGRAESETSLRDRVLAYCMASLGDPDLSMASIARRHGISVRYLHKVFSGSGMSLGAWIRRERLVRVHRDLRDPDLLGRGTADIAARWGVFDVAHLGRALKAEFGTSVQDLRREAALRRFELAVPSALVGNEP